MNFEDAATGSADSTILSIMGGTGNGHLELHFPADSFTVESVADLIGKMPDDAQYHTKMEPSINMWGEVLSDPSTWEFLGSLGAAVGSSATYDILKHLVAQVFEEHQEQKIDTLPDDEELERIARLNVAVRYDVPVSKLTLVGLAGNEDGSKSVILNDGLWKYTLTFRGSKAGARMVSYAKDLL